MAEVISYVCFDLDGKNEIQLNESNFYLVRTLPLIILASSLAKNA